MAQAVSHRPVIAEAWVRCQASQVGFVLENVASGQAFLRLLPFNPVSVIPHVLSIPISFTCVRRYLILAADSVSK